MEHFHLQQNSTIIGSSTAELQEVLLDGTSGEEQEQNRMLEVNLEGRQDCLRICPRATHHHPPRGFWMVFLMEEQFNFMALPLEVSPTLLLSFRGPWL